MVDYSGVMVYGRDGGRQARVHDMRTPGVAAGVSQPTSDRASRACWRGYVPPAVLDYAGARGAATFMSPTWENGPPSMPRPSRIAMAAVAEGKSSCCAARSTTLSVERWGRDSPSGLAAR